MAAVSTLTSSIKCSDASCYKVVEVLHNNSSSSSSTLSTPLFCGSPSDAAVKNVWLVA
jgi:hypothetical protein